MTRQVFLQLLHSRSYKGLVGKAHLLRTMSINTVSWSHEKVQTLGTHMEMNLRNDYFVTLLKAKGSDDAQAILLSVDNIQP